jgi:shikimate kinase
LVWLKAPVDVLWRRVSADPATASTRPPLTARTGMAEIEHLLAQRSPLYERASDLTIDTTQLTPSEVAKAIIEALYGASRP